MHFSLVILLGVAASVLVSGISTLILLSISWKSLFLTSTAAAIALLIFASTRHIQLQSRRGSRRAAKPVGLEELRGHGARRGPLEYNLFVLGSGGHTREMLMMMDDGFCDFRGFHRRYLISSGDSMSENHMEDYELDLSILCKKKKSSPGTYDKRIVTRARYVHQSLWTTPFTALLSILDIFPALLTPPMNPIGRATRYPRRIFSNGPATGFFVALVVYILKMFYVVPEHSMKFIYVESWARISTLSLTGKLLYHTGIADVFLTQHEEVAGKYSVQNAGELVFNSRRLDGL